MPLLDLVVTLLGDHQPGSYTLSPTVLRISYFFRWLAWAIAVPLAFMAFLVRCLVLFTPRIG